MKKILLFTLLITITASGQTQIGQTLIGNSNGDQFGKSVAMSSDGSIVAVGAPNTDTNGNFSGQVSVYQFNGSNWVQMGAVIEAEASQDHSGYSIDLSDDGSILAIGAKDNDGNGSNSGNVRMFEYTGSVWTQLGQDIDGEASSDNSGYSVSLSANGDIVAVGAYKNDGNGSNSGHVRVYHYISDMWVQVGQDIDGEASSDWSGWNVSLSSDGTILAIGAPYNDDNGGNSGHIRVFEFTGSTWEQLGTDIDGEAANENAGYSVSLSGDGSIVAIGAINEGGTEAGHARVYKYIGGTWAQLGTTIYGETDDELGFSVSLSDDGTIMAVGAPFTNFSGGKTFVYKYIDNSWEQVGSALAGSSPERLGTSVKLSSDGSKIIVGSSLYNTKGAAKIIDFSSVLSSNEYGIPEFAIYPNPTNSILNIPSAFGQNYNFSIYNSLGQKVHYQNNLSKQSVIDVSNLSKGLYFIEVSSFNGISETFKFIKN